MEVVYTSFIGVFDQKIVHDESEFDVPRHAEFDRATCGVKEQRRTDFLWREPDLSHGAETLALYAQQICGAKVQSPNMHVAPCQEKPEFKLL